LSIDELPYSFTASGKIAVDYLNYTGPIREVFHNHFLKPKIREFSGNREEIIDRLCDYNTGINAPKTVMEKIHLLSQTSTHAIITGQQPGIFSGPLYTIYKAISAITLCERLSTKKHILIPIFWNASEDHDFSEINHVTIFKQNKPINIYYPGKSKGLAFSHLRLNKTSVKKMLSEIDNVTPRSEFKRELLGEIEGIIHTSDTAGKFFSRFMTQILGKFGLVMIEPGFMRELMIPIFERLIRNPLKCTRILAETSAKLSKFGYKPKIHKKSKICNFFIINDKGKRLQVTHKGEFHCSGDTYSQKELLKLLNENPSAFSANAIIRPITQDLLFPTFGYVAGPNEIEYFAQLTGLYNFFSIDMPVIFPRFGATIVEKKIQKVMQKYNVGVLELRVPEKLLKKLAKERMKDVFQSFKNRISMNMEKITEKAVNIDKSLSAPSNLTRGKILREVEALENKVAAQLKEMDSLARQQICKAFNNLFPNQHLQERQINVLEYLIKFGDSFLRTVHKEFSKSRYGAHKVIEC
jgi:bacillithiol biosynthesis cysteine-adding enzyme BshC